MNVKLNWSQIAESAKAGQDEKAKGPKPTTVVDIQHTLNNALQSRQPQNPGQGIEMPAQSGFARTN